MRGCRHSRTTSTVVICSFDTFAYTTAPGIGLRSAYVGLYSAAWAVFGMDQFVATVSRRLSRSLAVLAGLGCLGIGPLVGVSLNLITPKFVPDRAMQVFVLVVFLVAVPVVAMFFCILGSFFTACRGSLVGNKRAFICTPIISPPPALFASRRRSSQTAALPQLYLFSALRWRRPALSAITTGGARRALTA